MVSYILNITKPNIWFYLRVLKDLGLKLEEKSETYLKDIVKEIGETRNKTVHTAEIPSEEEILDAFEKIANIFHILSPYSIFDKKRRIDTEWI